MNTSPRNQIAAGAALAAVAALLPWVTARSGWITLTANGLEMGRGYWTGLIAIVVAATALGASAEMFWRSVIGTGAVAIGALAAEAWWTVYTASDDDVYFSTGVGVYLTVAAAAVILHGVSRLTDEVTGNDTARY